MDIFGALEKAIEAEKKAQQSYKDAIELAEDAETRALFEQLVRWESDHETLLRNRLETLKMLRS